MNLYSIQTKITAIFLLALLLLISAFSFYYIYQDGEIVKQRQQHYKTTMRQLAERQIFNKSRSEVNTFFKNSDFTVMSDYSLMKKADHLEGNQDYDALVLDQVHYLHIHLPFMNYLLQNHREEAELSKGFIALFTFILILLFLVYFWIRNSLKPLGILQKEVANFAKGDYEINTLSEKKDEIALLANEFHYASSAIKALIHSRQLFLRTIMHELKTPIGKGRIVSALVKDTKQKERLDKIFVRLDGLIEEFAKIEQVVSKNYNLVKKPYKASTVISHAIEMLLLDEQKIQEAVHIEIESDFTLLADFELMTLGIKNLLDNALKYASDKKVHVHVSTFEITISNCAKPLSMDMQEYFKPFHNATEHQGGLGLGIYIVKSIIDLHHYQLQYRYKNGEINFVINSH